MENKNMENHTEPYPGSNVFSLGKYLKLLWHWAWLVLAAALISSCIAYGASKLITPVYKATTTLMVNGQSANEAISYATMEMNVQLAQTYAQMITQTSVLGEVAKKVGISSIDPDSITAEALTSMPLIIISVESSSPDQAAKIANTLVSVFQDQEKSLDTQRNIETENNILAQIDEIEDKIKNTNIKLATTIIQSDQDLLKARITNYQEIYSNLLTSYENIQATISDTTTSIIQVEPANPPLKPDRPKTLINVGIAFLVGLGLAVSLIYVLGLTDTSLKTPEEFSEALNIPVIGAISFFPTKNKYSIMDLDPNSKTQTDFYSLRTRFSFLIENHEKPLQTIMIVSASPHDGSSTIAGNLGKLIASTEKNNCLIDLNLRQPKIHELFELPLAHGLRDYYFGKERTFQETYLKSAKSGKIQILTAGEAPCNPQELIHSTKFSEMINQIKSSYELVLFDTPPALEVSDAFDLLKFVDGVVVVMRSGKTKLEHAQQTIEMLQSYGANILGIIVNGLPEEKQNVYGVQSANWIRPLITSSMASMKSLLSNIFHTR
jgi:capsular exopolysaccharide synthesis family protein